MEVEGRFMVAKLARLLELGQIPNISDGRKRASI